MTTNERIERLAARVSEQERSIGEIKNMLTSISEQIMRKDEIEEKDLPPRIKVMKSIMKNFDFEKVAKICHFMDWKMCGAEEGITVEFLMHDAEEKIKKAWEAFDSFATEEDYIVSSGPLKLSWHEFDDKICGELEFVAESWSSEADN